MNINQSGLLGEWKAARYLKKQGMRILAKRYRAGQGEIDLIADDHGMLVFVEVKYRPSGRMGDGFSAIDSQKKRRLRSAATCYLRVHPAPAFRFDAVEITASGIRHIPNAF